MQDSMLRDVILMLAVTGLATWPAGAHADPAGAAAPAGAATASQALVAPHHATKPGIDLQAMDRSVAAGDDFYRYANGRWLESVRIPADRDRWGRFDVLSERVNRELRRLIDGLNPAKSSADEVRVHTCYQAFLDTAGIEARGLAPLQAAFAAVDQVQDTAALSTALGSAVRADVDPVNNTSFHTPNLLGIWVAPSLHDASQTLAYLLQGGLSLPDREYYLSDAPRMATLRKRFAEHAERMFTLAGFEDAGSRARAVMDLETRIAQGHATRQDSEDVDRADHVWTRQDFDAHAPGLDWGRFLAAAGLEAQEHLGIWHPGALAAESRLAQEVPLAVWRDWMRLHLLETHASVLPKAFDAERFAFFGTALSGTPRQRERWQRALDATSQALPDAVGRIYAARYFPPSAKARAQAMVQTIIEAFDRRLDQLSWMAPATREQAREKLRTLHVGLGYPEQWESYEDLDIRADDPVGNQDRAGLAHRDHQLALLGHPYDHTRWCMTVQEVNAVNLPLQNALNFPAAILQPPFFDPEAPDAANYGSIGAVIGHEISHSFDDEGAKFDAQGTLRNWWTPEDLAHFQAAGTRLARQYSSYHPFPDAAVNGELTLSENIADVAGLGVAHDALLARVGAQQALHADKDALSPEQQFFIAFAQTWQQAIREATLRQHLVTDGHAPARFRAATVRNLDSWYRAFHVRRSQKLWLAPGERVAVW